MSCVGRGRSVSLGPKVLLRRATSSAECVLLMSAAIIIGSAVMSPRERLSAIFRIWAELNESIVASVFQLDTGADISRFVGALIGVVGIAQPWSPVGRAALLCFEDEGAAFVAVNPAETYRAVAVILEYAALEHIVVLTVVGAAAMGWLNPNQRHRPFMKLCVFASSDHPCHATA